MPPDNATINEDVANLLFSSAASSDQKNTGAANRLRPTQTDPMCMTLIAVGRPIGWFAVLLAWACFGHGNGAWCLVFQETPPRRVERANRPQFNPSDWEGVYFPDLFREGLVGARPPTLGRPSPAAVVPDEPKPNAEAAPSGVLWADVISAQALEDEIKKGSLALSAAITTPQAFKTAHGAVRESLFVLSTAFGIVSEYEEDVRWKAEAPAVLAGLARAAANARTNSDEAFASARLHSEQLAELIRGGKLDGTAESPPEGRTWNAWTDRISLMKRLEIAFEERLKPWTSNEQEFGSRIEEISHEANWVAAIGRVLCQPTLDDAEESEYVADAQAMSAAAKAVRDALQNNNYEAASGAVNRLGQACSDCHEAYR
jgi:hypothetical protein